MGPSPFKASTQILLAITQTQQQIKNPKIHQSSNNTPHGSCHCCQLHEENNQKMKYHIPMQKSLKKTKP
jgi:hypothetical protein